MERRRRPWARSTSQLPRGAGAALFELLPVSQARFRARHGSGSVAWVLLRCTTRLLELLGDPMTEERPASPDDWYANLFWVQRRKCLLVTHAETLFSVFAPAVRVADLRPLDAFVAPLIARQLAAEGFSAAALGPLDRGGVGIAKTADRQVLGCMNDIARACQHAAADAGGLARLDLTGLHYRLQRNITSARDYIPAIDLLASRVQRARG
jgi:hypothetical protein